MKSDSDGGPGCRIACGQLDDRAPDSLDARPTAAGDLDRSDADSPTIPAEDASADPAPELRGREDGCPEVRVDSGDEGIVDGKEAFAFESCEIVGFGRCALHCVILSGKVDSAHR